jgi:hypothetical protein
MFLLPEVYEMKAQVNPGNKFGSSSEKGVPCLIRPMSDFRHLLAQKSSPLQPQLGAARVGSNGSDHVSCCRLGPLSFLKGMKIQKQFDPKTSLPGF